ncbi:hypothetical protein J437_LFUL019216 [Ladona fulva]|uniref:Ribosomal protein L1 n=1 Tax=Ladona fulva TaxID=123851 RepID=A0A8K0PA11_LADFU|nr:hypothetical protein J437_LFUL019216 [Ladona fulva]
MIVLVQYSGKEVIMLPWKYITGSRNLLRPYGVILSSRAYAARKGYREKAKKKKVKVEEKKVGFIPHNLRNLDKFKPTTSRRIDDSWKRDPTDDVYLGKFYKWKVYSFAEALQCHRESHHPTVYNLPSAPLNVTIELDMRADKKNKYVEKFTRIVGIPCPFNHGETRKIVAFCKSTELQQIALDAGANVSGGSELIKSIQVGDLSMHDHQYVVAHNDILPELVSIRGLLKKNFPTTRNGTLTNDVAECIERLSKGINYSTQRDSYEEDYGWIDTCLGTVSGHLTE